MTGKSCRVCEEVIEDPVVHHIDENHHVFHGQLSCQHEDGGGGTKNISFMYYCKFCGTEINLPDVL